MAMYILYYAVMYILSLNSITGILVEIAEAIYKLLLLYIMYMCTTCPGSSVGRELA